ncbi:MAG: DMT family transporter [Methanobacteriota archaeon]
MIIPADEDGRSKVAVVAAIISVSTAAVMIRMCESGPLTVAFYRLLFTTLMVAPWALAKDGGCFAGLSKGEWAKLAGIGLVLAVHFSLWVTSLGMTSVANSTVLVTTHPIFVAAISFAFLGESPKKSALIGAFVAFVGVAIMFAGDLSGDGLAGDLLAIGGALAAGTYIVGGRLQRKRLNTGAYCLIVYGFATAFLAPLAFLESGFAPTSGNDWYILLAMAAVAGVLGHTMYNYALGRVSAFIVSTSLLGEPILSSIMAWLILSEAPTEWTMFGAPLVFVGILLASGLGQAKPAKG